VLDDHVQWDRVGRVLDIGAGDGWIAEEIAHERGDGTLIVCWDESFTDADLDADLPPSVERTRNPPDGTFDLVLMLDVLEHIEDDTDFLDKYVTPALAPDARLMITVPAYPSLFVEHDRALAHFRRYSPGHLQSVIAPRYEIVARGGLFASLLVPRAVTALGERLGRKKRSTGVGAWPHGDGLSKAMTRALDADASVGYWLSSRGLRLPGLSTWLVARPAGSR